MSRSEKINFDDVSLGAVQNTKITTNNGNIYPLRGAWLIPIKDGLFTNTSFIPSDPQGPNYLGAFLSSMDYQLFATLERPGTRIPTALVKGSFSKESNRIATLVEDINETTTSFSIDNAQIFVKDDIIKIENEEMTIISFDYEPNKAINKITVKRSNSAKPHNKNAFIKLVSLAKGADSLLCLGSLKNIAGEIINDTNNTWEDNMIGINKTGVFCVDDKTIVRDSKNLPYKVSADLKK